MNLQVCVPYERCVYNCPMCVAKGHKHHYEFKNLYVEDKEEYGNKLRYINDYNREYFENVIITGECDPTQNMGFVKYIIGMLKLWHKDELKIELQTHNYNVNVSELDDLDVLSYSITDSKAYLRSYKFPRLKDKTNRIVILLTKEFAFLNKNNFEPMGFDQVTFKTLQYGEDKEINKWIDENKLEDLSNIYDIVNKYNGTDISIRIDTSCQNAKGRYKILRSDGKLYENWESKESLEKEE